MNWEASTEAKFKLIISKLPLFHRHIAESAVQKKAEENAVARKSAVIEEKDVVKAFFSEVPMPFYSMMIRLLDVTGFDYKKCGYPQK